MNKSAQRYVDLAFEYHVAAMTLNTQIFDAPYLYNPTVYLLRHTIELLLKGLVIIYAVILVPLLQHVVMKMRCIHFATP